MTLANKAAGMFITLLFLIASHTVSAQMSEFPHYDLELRFYPDEGSLSGRAMITYPESAVRDHVVRLNIGITGDKVMDVAEIRGPSNQPLRFDGPDSDGVLLVTVAEGAHSFAVDYSFSVDTTHLDLFGYYIFAPLDKTPWAYPSLERVDSTSFHFADFAVRFDCPSSFSVLTSGGDGERRTMDGRTETRAAATHVESFAIVAGQGFEVVRNEEGGVAVVAFYHPDFAERFGKIMKHTQEAAAWYRKTYGFFPLEQVCIVQGHPTWQGGFPLPNVFGIHLGALESQHLIWITAHEVGHYYFGLHVLGEGGNLDWLQLALGIWCDQFYLAERNEISLPEQWRNSPRQGDWFTGYLRAVVANREQRLDMTRSEWRALDFDYNSLIRHGKAATGIFLQSMLLGPDRFLEFQKELLNEYRHRVLTVDEFVTRLQEAGLPGARDFFDAWIRGHALIDIKVADIKPDDTGTEWLVNVQRTGSVPYPVSIEVDLPGGAPVRHVMPAERERDTIHVSQVPERVRIDADGIIPMWSSSHPEIRGAFVRAFDWVGYSDIFLSQARDLLSESPDDDFLRYRLLRRLFWLAKYEEAAALWPQSRPVDSHDGCIAAIYAARALQRLGDMAAAQARVESLKEIAAGYDLASLWELVQGEVAAE